MPTIFTHTVVALGGGAIYAKKKVPQQFWWASIVCASFPDADVMAFALGIPYGDFWGHRGFFHSLTFAFILAVLVTIRWFPEARKSFRKALPLVTYFFLLTGSHGVLDACTNGGYGIALLSPFSNERYFLPWQFLEVSPIGGSFFSERGLIVMQSEIVCLWLPLGALLALCLLLRKHKENKQNKSMTAVGS